MRDTMSTIFFTTNHRWLVVIGSNSNLTLNYFFASTITTSNNLPLKICCKNIVDISFLFQDTKNVFNDIVVNKLKIVDPIYLSTLFYLLN